MPHNYVGNGAKRIAIRQLADLEPELTPLEIAQRLGTCRDYVYKTLQRTDHRSNPTSARIRRLESRVRMLEEAIFKILAAKRLTSDIDDVNL